MKYSKIRTAFLTCILGIVSVSFFKFEYEKWNEPYIELPKLVSESPIIISPCEATPESQYKSASLCESSTKISIFGIASHSSQTALVCKLFMALPKKYFYIESLNWGKKEYLDRFLEVEDDKNGYMEGSGDGAQDHFKMSLFKQPNGRTIIGFYVWGEDGEKSIFLEYKNKKWRDVGKEVVPQYKKNNIYHFSLSQKMAEVYTFEKVNGEFEYHELYNLVWKNDKFVIEAKTDSNN